MTHIQKPAHPCDTGRVRLQGSRTETESGHIWTSFILWSMIMDSRTWSFLWSSNRAVTNARNELENADLVKLPMDPYEMQIIHNRILIPILICKIDKYWFKNQNVVEIFLNLTGYNDFMVPFLRGIFLSIMVDYCICFCVCVSRPDCIYIIIVEPPF